MCGSGVIFFASSTSPFFVFAPFAAVAPKAVGGEIVPVRTFSSTSSSVLPSTGGRSVRIAYKMPPSEKMSDRPSRSSIFPQACSGLMYCGVPMTAPTRVAGEGMFSPARNVG